MNARELARRALRRIEAEQAFAAQVLDTEAAGATDERDRGLASEIVYGVLRHRSRLDAALEAMAPRGLKVSAALRTVLRVAAYQILFLDRVPAHAAVDDAVGAARRIGGPRMGGFVNGLLRRLAAEGEPAASASPEIRFSLPAWILDHLARRLPAAELEPAAAALAQPAPLYLRANTLRGGRDELLARLAADHPSARFTACEADADAIAAEGLGDPERSPSFAEGWWTVQDLGAQRVTRLVEPRAGQRLLDACAGVGGKSTYLAQLTGDRAAIDAADRSARRLALGEAAAHRLGITHIRFHVVDLARELPPEGPWDAVLLDAPCTGLGVLRRHPEAKWRLRPEAVGELAALQASLLDRVAAGVVDGGALVYSVCTFTGEEGPAQVAAFCARHPQFTVEAALETWPHRDGADGFYAARLLRATGP